MLDKENQTKGMHPMSPYYKNKPNFQELAEKYPDIMEDCLVHHSGSNYVSIDWTNPSSQRSLTTALLRHDFGVNKFMLPSDKLCPPVPNRVNYVCWVQELLVELVTSESYRSSNCGHKNDSTTAHAAVDDKKKDPFMVLDVGVGASCIYPLIGHKLFGWRCVGSDIDSSSLENCRRIVSGNNLDNVISLVEVESCIKLQKVLEKFFESPSSAEGHSGSLCSYVIQSDALSDSDRKGPVIQSLEALGILDTSDIGNDEGGHLIDACMMNPPFYDVNELVEENCYSSCSGSQAEMHTPGGEVAFVVAIVLDSLVLRRRVGWYSTMLGKKQSLKVLLRVLKSAGLKMIQSTKFIQGAATVRWGLAWSFHDDNLARIEKNIVESRLEKNLDVTTIEGISKTALEAELMSTASSISMALDFEACPHNPSILRSISTLENYLRNLECSTESVPDGQHFALVKKVLKLEGNDSCGDCESCGRELLVGIRKIVLLCLCVERVNTFLVKEGNFFLDFCNISSKSLDSFIIPLQCLLEEHTAQFDILLSLDCDKILLTLSVEMPTAEPILSETRCVCIFIFTSALKNAYNEFSDPFILSSWTCLRPTGIEAIVGGAVFLKIKYCESTHLKLGWLNMIIRVAIQTCCARDLKYSAKFKDV